MPNWLNGILSWAKGHRAQALGVALGLLVMAWYLFLSGDDPQVARQQEEEELFGAGAVPGDATTAKALTEMQVAVENLGFALSQQQEKHDRLLREVQAQATQFGARLERPGAFLHRAA